MHRIAHALLLALLWLLGGGLMLASGRAPLGTLLVLIGLTLPVLAAHGLSARHGAESGPAVPPPGGRLRMWTRLRRRDALWLLLSVVVGAALAVFGLSCRCGVG